MQAKKYVVITDAKRWRVISSPVKATAERMEYDYRTGDLGLIHPTIVDFFSDFEKNTLAKKLIEDDGFSRRKDVGYKFNSTSGILECYEYDSNDVPVLIYENKDNFVISPLRLEEYTEIEGLSLDEIKDGVKKINKEKNISKYSPNLLEKNISKHWAKLEYFDNIIKNGNIYINQIPIEVAQRHISEEEVESLRQLYETLNELTRISKIPKDGVTYP